MRRRDNDTVGDTCLAPAVVSENRAGNDRGRGILISFGKHDLHAVCRQHLKSTGESRHGKGMRIHAEKQRSINLVLLSIQADRLADSEDMPFIESLIE